MARSLRVSDRRDDAPDRGLAGLVRLFAMVLVVCALALGAVAFAPQFAETLEDVSPTDDDPPDPDVRTPERVDPDDPGATTYETDAELVTSTAVEDSVHEEVNERRAEHGLEPLAWDGTIASVSRAHSADMREREYFAHRNPDGEDPWDRYSDVAGYCSRYGENIATTWVGQPVERPSDGELERYETAEGLADGLVDQWMNSTAHREAILADDWDRAGVGVHLSGDGRVFATQNFCTDR